MAVWFYFIICLFGRQFLMTEPDSSPAKKKFDLIFPILSTLEIIFILGWLKVAEVMSNPCGLDEDDFEMNWILDRNLQARINENS